MTENKIALNNQLSKDNVSNNHHYGQSKKICSKNCDSQSVENSKNITQ